MILLKKLIITEFPSHFVIPAKVGIQRFQVFKAIQTGFPPSSLSENSYSCSFWQVLRLKACDLPVYNLLLFRYLPSGHTTTSSQQDLTEHVVYLFSDRLLRGNDKMGSFSTESVIKQSSNQAQSYKTLFN